MPKVANAAVFEEMRQHILKINEGMQVTHSFAVGSQTYDCMAIESQPAIRLLGLKGVATPPAPKAPPSGATGAHASVLPASGVDRFGNAVGCQDKAVPIVRTTLEQMARFQTLQAFLRPAGKSKPLAANDSSGVNMSAAIITEQVVYNMGISSTLSINQPELTLPIEWPGSGGHLSESQVVILGGPGEAILSGWRVDPDYYGDQQSHLFASVVGENAACDDYECGAFVQYDGSLFLGVPLSLGGEATIQWLWSDGNWWFQVNGTWVGYYPGAVFGGGDMATHGDAILLEGVAEGNGYVPQMGSGYWGTSGLPYAAYQRQIFYFDGAYNGIYATGLQNPPNISCPASTSAYGPYWDGVGDFGVYFFFGGPGGFCQ